MGGALDDSQKMAIGSFVQGRHGYFSWDGIMVTRQFVDSRFQDHPGLSRSGPAAEQLPARVASPISGSPCLVEPGVGCQSQISQKLLLIR